MKIDAYGNIKATNSPKKRTIAAAGTDGIFSGLLAAAEAEEAVNSQAASDVHATASLSNLLALQEISEDDVKRRKLIQQGGDMLDSLEKLRRCLLMGTINMGSLREISRQINIQKQAVSDPRLMEIIAEIELRAAVELAKLEMATGNNLSPS